MKKSFSPCLFLAIAMMLMFGLYSCVREPEPTVVQQPKATDPLATVTLLEEENKKVTHQAIQDISTYPAEIAAIVKRGKIVFAMTNADQKPFFYVDEKSGKLIGLDVELGLAIANKLGVTAEFNRAAASFDDVVRNVANGKADVAVSKLSRTLKRAQLVLYTQPYITFRQALLVNRLQLAKLVPESELSTFVRSFRGKLGLIANSSYVGYAQTNFSSAEITQFPSWDNAVDALFAGEVLAVYRDELEILKILATRKDAALLAKAVFLTDLRDPIAIAVSKDAPVLKAWLDIFLDEYIALHTDELSAQSLVDRYFKK